MVGTELVLALMVLGSPGSGPNPDPVCDPNAPVIVARFQEAEDWGRVLHEMKLLNEHQCEQLPKADVVFVDGLVRKTSGATAELKQSRRWVLNLAEAVLARYTQQCKAGTCPTDPTELFLLQGEVAEKLGKPQDALSAFQMAGGIHIEVNAMTFEPLSYFAKALAEQGNFEDSVSVLANLHKIDQGSQFQTVEVYVKSLQTGGKADALQALRAKVGIVPSAELAYCESLRFLGRRVRARACFSGITTQVSTMGAEVAALAEEELGALGNK